MQMETGLLNSIPGWLKYHVGDINAAGSEGERYNTR